MHMKSQKINRLKVVLVENGKTGKWLAGQVGKNEATVSRWCSNKMQPSLDMLVKIAELLNGILVNLSMAVIMTDYDTLLLS